jgi:hypothetical protein
MPRPRQRVRLESGLKLDLNKLMRNGFAKPGAMICRPLQPGGHVSTAAGFGLRPVPRSYDPPKVRQRPASGRALMRASEGAAKQDALP